MKLPDFIIFSGSKEQGCGLIIDKYQSHNTSSLILKNQYIYAWAQLAPQRWA
jgi:hypothetical protein